MATLFYGSVRMPDVFLYNNPILHAHLLSSRYRSLFSELVNQNIIQVMVRQNVKDYSSMLDVVTTDTIAGVPLRRAVAIQDTSEEVTECLASVAPGQIFGDQPTIGEHSSGESFGGLLETHAKNLSKNHTRLIAGAGRDLAMLATKARKRLDHIEGAGVRRAVVIWEMAQRLPGDVVSEPAFFSSPYRAILEGTPTVGERDRARREMLELTYVYHSNLARLYGGTLVWPELGGTRERPDLALTSNARVNETFGRQRSYLRYPVYLPSFGRLKSMGPELVDLRQLGKRYFDDLQSLENGTNLPVGQLAESLVEYASRIRRDVGSTQTNHTKVLTIVSGAFASGSLMVAPLGAASGPFTMLAAVADSARRKRNVVIYRRFGREAVPSHPANRL